MYQSSLYGAGSGPIFLTDVLCTNSETSLLQCNSDPILSSGCSHSEDAGVKCEGMSRIDQHKTVFSCLHVSIYFHLQLHVLMDS